MRLSKKTLLLSEAAVIAAVAVISYLLPMIRPVSAFITGVAAIAMILIPYVRIEVNKKMFWKKREVY